MRRKLRQDIEKNKQEIMDKFNKVKTGKVINFILTFLLFNGDEIKLKQKNSKIHWKGFY